MIFDQEKFGHLANHIFFTGEVVDRTELEIFGENIFVEGESSQSLEILEGKKVSAIYTSLESSQQFSRHILLQPKASLEVYLVLFQGCQVDLQIELQKDSKLRLYVISNLENTLVNLKLFISAEDDTHTDVLVKSLLGIGSEFSFQGVVSSLNGANGVQASMYHKALLTSENAHVVSRPELFIQSDTAIAKHGTAISHLDESVLWYLASLGIQDNMAKEMLANGFFKDILEAMEPMCAQTGLKA